MISKRSGQIYELIIRGELGDHHALLFEGMHLERAGGDTVLTGAVYDQSHLYGLIQRTQDLGLELMSVNQVPNERRASE
ncbi:hypothetical protein SAMN04488564_12439 [Lentzea waywayandensis]|uniref:Uncharacterized protein n=1 Tax=Lentzea waywayandensis TaxID=84724 RepID=A0A1I6FJ32_9PSEU|nr:hypothetical protein [Lentzea waywayandensis]SFR29946.1 hypothetical protein SAMN04488564_12439 [Lentzea waywayandensis]